MRREINLFSLSFLDLISGALGAVIILYVAVPKKTAQTPELETLKVTNTAMAQKVQDLERQVSTLKETQAQLERTTQENELLRQQVAVATQTASDAIEKVVKSESEGTGLDVGFKFKGRNIVFLIDTSRSMLEEDRMGQVKAGLKMLLTSMPSNYNVDIVQFPNGGRTPFRALFGKTQKLNAAVKGEVFDFIYGLKPLGATPTRDVMNYVLSTYADATDVVLLTDGEPSVHNSPLKDDIYDLLNHIRKLNPGTKLQINTIGVGEEVLYDKTGKPYQFLKLLAEQNGGFFVGF